MSVGLLQLEKLTGSSPLTLSNYTFQRQAILLALLLVWFSPGVIDRSLWKPIEAILVPIAYESLLDGWSVSLSQLGETYVSHPPFYLYTAVLTAKLLDPLVDFHSAMRLSNFIWLALGFSVVGVLLSKRHGSRVGWRSVLLIASSLGLLLNARMVNPDVTLIFISATGLYGAYLLQTKGKVGGVLLGLSASLGFWCVGNLALWYTFLLLVVPLFYKKRPLKQSWSKAHTLAIILLAVAEVGSYGTIYASDPALAEQTLMNGIDALALPAIFIAIQAHFVSAIWVTWPSLPFAIMVYLRWHYKKQRVPEVPLGMLGLACGFVALVLSGAQRESSTFILLPPIAVMAAAGMQQITKETAKMVDWFAVLMIGFGLIGFFWLAWFAMIFGVPANLVAWINNIGIDSASTGFTVFFAALATIAWIALIMRTGQSPERAVLNWMAGMTMAWLVFSLLWIQPLDKAKGYDSVAASMREALPVDVQCVSYQDLDKNDVAQIAYLSGIKFRNIGNEQKCNWLLVSQESEQGLNASWTGIRPGDQPHEGFALIKI